MNTKQKLKCFNLYFQLYATIKLITNMHCTILLPVITGFGRVMLGAHISIFCPEWPYRSETRYSTETQDTCSQAPCLLTETFLTFAPVRNTADESKIDFILLLYQRKGSKRRDCCPVLLFCITVSNCMVKESPFKKNSNAYFVKFSSIT